MTENEILHKITHVFQRVLESPKLSLSRDATPELIDKWDSLHHVMLITEIEKEFDVSFEFSEMQEIYSVEDIIQLIQKK